MAQSEKSGGANFFPGQLARNYKFPTYTAKHKSIADMRCRLVLSPKSVRNHVSNILSKLQVADRTEAMHAAWTAGLGQGGGEPTPTNMLYNPGFYILSSLFPFVYYADYFSPVVSLVHLPRSQTRVVSDYCCLVLLT